MGAQFVEDLREKKRCFDIKQFETVHQKVLLQPDITRRPQAALVGTEVALVSGVGWASPSFKEVTLLQCQRSLRSWRSCGRGTRREYFLGGER